MYNILVAEDDSELRNLFKHVLIKSGYEVKGVNNGAEALDAIDKEEFSLLISDIMMPVMDGYELVKELRDAANMIPIIIITAKNAFDDMRLGFKTGADDYMVKPININEMVLRVQALLRRGKLLEDKKVTIGNTTLEYDTFSVISNKKRIILTQKEFQLLYKMSSNPGRIFTKQQLMDDIWGYDTETDAHTVEVHIGRLRDHLSDNDDIEIKTMRGVGYKVEKK